MRRELTPTSGSALWIEGAGELKTALIMTDVIDGRRGAKTASLRGASCWCSHMSRRGTGEP